MAESKEQVNSLVNGFSDRVNLFHVETYHLSLHGIEVSGIEERTLYNLCSKPYHKLYHSLNTFGYNKLTKISK